MNQIRTWNSKTIELDAVLRHFLKSRKISTQLGVRITNFFKTPGKQFILFQCPAVVERVADIQYVFFASGACF